MELNRVFLAGRGAGTLEETGRLDNLETQRLMENIRRAADVETSP